MLFLQQQEKRPRSNQSFFREQFFFTHLAPYWQISYECTVFFVDGAGFFYREKKQKFVCRYVCACIKLVYCVCVCVRVRKPIQAAQAGKNSLLFFLENVYKHTKINPIRLVLASQMSTKRSCCFLFVFVHKNSLGCSFLFPRTQTATKNTHFLLLFVLFVDSTSRDTSVCVCVCFVNFIE